MATKEMENSLTNPITGRVGVLLPVAVDRVFDYRLPNGVAVTQGMFVAVPFRGKGTSVGVVWGQAAGDLPDSKLKTVAEVLDLPPLQPELVEFVSWVAAYTLTPLGMVLRMVLSAPAALGEMPQQMLYRLADNFPLPRGEEKRPTQKQRLVIDILQDGHAMTLTDLAKEAAVGVGVIKTMAKAGLLQPVSARRRSVRAGTLDPDYAAPDLTPDQAQAATALRAAVKRDAFSVRLLDGVTGSGKTEVYFEAIAQALAEGRQALVLVPEIALSAQFVDRFRPRFGDRPAIWHSDLTPAKRRDTWRGVADGSVRVVIGARSALFLPFASLGVIVVDEENDPSFKQEDQVIYQARDMAVVRAKIGDFPAVLVSATPSLETLVNVEAGRYAHLTLPARFGGATLPKIELIDLRQTGLQKQRFIAQPLVDAIAETIGVGEQTLLFLNRRGYAPLTLCRVCGHRVKCPNCTSWLVEHRAQNRLVCHYCAHHEPIPDHCPKCDAEGSMVPVGPGVERIAEEVRALFPEARLALMASDLMEGQGVLAETLRKIGRNEIDIIVGTQIIAKGHHFPKLTLVGVIDADLGLAGGDLRAGERTYQLMQQVAGRAGRAQHEGRALIQTYDPAHPVMQALLSGDRDRFMDVEKSERQAASMPPYTRLAALIVSGEDQMAVEQVAITLGRIAPHGPEIRVLGPAPAPLFMLRGRYRHRLLLRTARTLSPQAIVQDWLGRMDIPNTVRVQVDIDPYGFM
jgi:primosomal protein N' (replication factor Y)